MSANSSKKGRTLQIAGAIVAGCGLLEIAFGIVANALRLEHFLATGEDIPGLIWIVFGIILAGGGALLFVMGASGKDFGVDTDEVYSSGAKGPDGSVDAGAYPMNWHKFLIYFALWASGILNLISGINTLTGKTYEALGMSPKLIYGLCDGLQTVDMVYGLALLAVAGFAIFVRFQLAGFKRTAPAQLLCCYAAGPVSSILYFVGLNSVTKVATLMDGTPLASVFLSACVGTCIGAAIMMAVNYVYYKKRAALFVN